MQTPTGPRTSPHQSATIEDAAAGALESESIVEFVSVAGFLRRIPHDQPWQYSNVRKFGDMVRNLAAAFGVEYHSTVDRLLGRVQTFPEPLVRQIYRFQAPSLGWPQLIEPSPDDVTTTTEQPGPKEELRLREAVAGYLAMVVETSEDSKARSCARGLLNTVRREVTALQEMLKRLNGEVPTPAPASDQDGLPPGASVKEAA